MPDRVVPIAKDPVKERLKQLRAKIEAASGGRAVLTPQETEEMLKLLCEKAGVK